MSTTSTSTSLSQVDSNYVKNISRENSEPTWMSEMRETAFSKYNSLPFETSPLYSKYSDAKRLHPELVHIPQTHKQFEPNQDTIERIGELKKEEEKVLDGVMLRRRKIIQYLILQRKSLL